jgi:hypothetical protein
MDNYGQIGRNWADDSWQKDGYGRLWTRGSALQNRRLQVRFLSHLPLSDGFIRITAPYHQHNVCAATPI